MYVGFVFLLYGGTQAIATPLWGMVLDKVTHCKFVTLAGSMLILTGYLLIGPAPFFDMKP
jgi:drug/metabolite transporter superfamily protein YnfA